MELERDLQAEKPGPDDERVKVKHDTGLSLSNPRVAVTPRFVGQRPPQMCSMRERCTT